jgi:hypothetical protein
LEEYLNAWITDSAIGRDKKGRLFRTNREGNRLGERAMSDVALHMI